MEGFTIRFNDIDPTGELERAFMEHEIARDGSARQALWSCRDGWIVGYTTERVRGGPHDGGFVALAYKPVGKGARSGNATEHVRVYIRRFATRKSARARAEKMHDQHS